MKILDRAGITALIFSDAGCVVFHTDSSRVQINSDDYDALMHMFSRVFFAGKEERSREIMELLRVDDEKSSNSVRDEFGFDPLSSPESVEDYCKKAGIPFRKGMFIYNPEDRGQ